MDMKMLLSKEVFQQNAVGRIPKGSDSSETIIFHVLGIQFFCVLEDLLRSWS